LVKIMNEKILTRKNFGYGLLLGGLITLFGFICLQSGSLTSRNLEKDIKKQLLERVAEISSAISPKMVSTLAFTSADKGTPAFDFIRRQMINMAANGSQRGIYSMAMRDGKIVFGPESYLESDPMASPPGTVYEKPHSEFVHVLQNGRSAVFGPYTDEYGSFVSAVMPVMDPISGRVLMVVGIDMSAADWQARLNETRWRSFLAMLLVVLVLAVCIALTWLRNRQLKPGVLQLKRWIMIPTAMLLLAVAVLYGSYQYQKTATASSQVMQRITHRAQTMLLRGIAAKTTMLKAQMDIITMNPGMLANFRSRDLKLLSKFANPVFEHLRQDFAITHLYFITPEYDVFLRVHHPDRRGDRIDRSTLIAAHNTGEDFCGLELGPLGTFTLRYVRPLLHNGAVVGYVELGRELEIFAVQLMRDMQLDFVFAINKALTNKEKFEAGSAVFGFDGQWDDYSTFVVTHTSAAGMLPELNGLLSSDYTQVADSQAFKIRQSEDEFVCGVIPVRDVMGQNAAMLIVMRNVTAEAAAARTSFYLHMGMVAVLFGGLLLLLWVLTGLAEVKFGKAYSSLRENSQLFRTLYKNALSGVAMHEIIVDQTGNPVDYVFLDANPSFETHTGLSVADVVGRRASEVFPLINDSSLIEIYGRVALTGSTASFEKFIESMNRFMQISAFRIGPGRFATIFQDITQRKHAEVQVKQNQDLLSAVLQNANDAIIVVDKDGSVVFWNRAAEILYGYAKQDVLGSEFLFIIPERYRDQHRDRFHALAAGRFNLTSGFGGQGPGLKNDGTEFICETSTDLLKQGDMQLMIVIVRDITQRVEDEEAMRQGRENLQTIFNNNPLSIAITDIEDGRFIEINEAFETFTGYSRTEVCGRTPADLDLFQDSDKLHLYRQQVETQGGCSDLEITLQSKTGVLYTANLSAKFIDYEGRRCLLTCAEDITGRKETEQALEQELQQRKRVEVELVSSRDLLNEAQQIAHIGVWTFNVKNQEFIWSDEVYRILGLSQEIPLDFNEFSSKIYPDDSRIFLSRWNDMESDSSFTEYDYRIVRPDGEIRYIHEYALFHTDEEGGVSDSAALMQDITERKVAEHTLANELVSRRKVEAELLASSDLLEEAQQIAHIGVWTFDSKTQEFIWSDEVYRILGLTQETTLDFYEFARHMHPDDYNSIAMRWNDMEHEEPFSENEYRIIRPDGEIRHIHQYTIYRSGEDDNCGRSTTLLQDITERKDAETVLEQELQQRKRVEADLVASSDLLTEAQHIAHIGVWTFDINIQEFIWSDEVYRILGLSRETPLDFNEFVSKVHPDDSEIFKFRLNDMESDSLFAEYDYRIVRPDGEIRYIHEYAIFHIDEEGSASDSVALMQDITERKLSEVRLSQLSQAVEQSPVSIVITDPDGDIQYVNPHFIELTGYAAEEVLGRNPRILKSGEMSSEVYLEMWQMLTAGREWWGSFHNKKKNGELYWEEATISPMRDEQGVITHFLATKQDITERKRVEQELLSANTSLELSMERANEMVVQAELANISKSEFLANMSHEIRTPMNGVIGMTGLLLDSELTSEQRQYAHIVRSCGESLLALINDILDLSKIEAGKLDLEVFDFDLRATMEDTAELLSVKAYEKGIEVVCMVDPDVPVLLRGDPGRLRQLFMNIGGNAVKFTDQGSITLRAMLEAEEEDRVTVRFTVVDTGIGISDDKKELIFAPFTQADGSTTRKYGGTGLGLSISRSLAECMDGTIGVESLPGQGSTFWFTAVLEKQQLGSRAEPPPMADLKGVRVLVVDDHTTNRLLVTTLLNGWGCRFAEAVDADSALERLHGAAVQKDPYSIALLDMHMPGVSGDELGRRIKQSPDIAATHLIMMTSLGQRGDGASFQAVGFEGYLNKPLRQALLRECMAMVLGRAHVQQQGEGGLIITRHTITEARKLRLRILVAEDNATNQIVALKMLEKLGYRADAVADGSEAITALQSIPYDLVLMDCQMPNMDGFEAAMSIRSETSNVLNPKVPVVAMTAHAMKGDREKCLEAGMDDYMSKPIEPAAMSAMLELWLADTSAPDAPLDGVEQVPKNGQEADACDVTDLDTPLDKVLPVPGNGREPDAEAPAVFDRQNFQNRVLGDEDVMKLVIEKFLSDIPEQIDLLAAASSDGDCECVSKLGHKIRGAAANIGAEALRSAAFEFEQAGKEGDIERVRELQPGFSHLFDELSEAFIREGLAG